MSRWSVLVHSLPKKKPKPRSNCPLNIAMEMIGDRWSLLIVRDLMVMHARTFKDLMACPEKIASNILSDRLRKLVDTGIITTRADPVDARRITYHLTEKGVNLAPVIAELVLWAAKHEQTGNQPLVELLQRDKPGAIAQVRREWDLRRTTSRSNAPG